MKYVQHEAGSDGWSKWIVPINPKRHKIACCDCCLTHIFEFRVYKGNIEFRVRIDRRATAAIRREARKKAA